VGYDPSERRTRAKKGGTDGPKRNGSGQAAGSSLLAAF